MVLVAYFQTRGDELKIPQPEKILIMAPISGHSRTEHERRCNQLDICFLCTTMSDPAELTKDNTYYFEDGNCILRVENHLFNVSASGPSVGG